MRLLYFLFILIFIFPFNKVKSQDSLDYKVLSKKILASDSANKKLIWSSHLITKLTKLLEESENITPLDSTGLLFELISDNDDFQIITWAIEFNDKWEYYGLLKSYNQIKKKYQVFNLLPTKFIISKSEKGLFDHDNWPAGVYLKLIENKHNNRKYYTFLGWLAPEDQTSYKFIEVMTLSKSGKPFFGKTNYFKRNRNYNKRKLFIYSRQSNFLLDYGEYVYTKRKWNRKKKKYDILEYSDDLIVFDHLVSKFPNMGDLPELMVPAGNLIDAFKFENGKWTFISDIDARNIKRKKPEKESLKLDLFDESGNQSK